MGLDDADGWRCGGVLIARREYGDAHEWVERVLDRCFLFGRGEDEGSQGAGRGEIVS